jgi:hypothetical protein
VSDVNPGDRLSISAGDWNTIRRRMRAREIGDGSRVGSRMSPLLATTPSIALARNMGVTDIARGDVVRVSAPIIIPADNEEEWWGRLALEVQHPATMPPGAWLGVARAPIAAGKFGRVAVAGVVQCRLNVTDAGHLFAGANAGDTILRSRASGPHTIIWRETGTGAKRALVHLGGAQVVQEVTAWLTGGAIISGAANRWEYDWQEVQLHASSGWQAKSGGLSSAAGEPKAWNGVEATNDGSGRESAGVDIAPTSYSTATLLRIGHGGLKPVYRMWREPIVSGTVGAYRWIFTEGNEIDVACEE